MSVYPFIAAEKAGRRSVTRACELLEVSRSAFTSTPGTGLARARQDRELTAKITAVHAASNGTYGAPRVHAELTDAGLRHGRKRIARLMRTAGLTGQCPRRRPATTVADPGAPARPDLISRDFTVDTTAVDIRWCGDITCIATHQGWLYLATVIDLASRRVVGWATAEHPRTELVNAALTDALQRRRSAPGLVFPSDRGARYTSTAYARLAAQHDIRLSVGRRGQCWDNTRRHFTLGYSSPATYENHHQPHPTGTDGGVNTA